MFVNGNPMTGGHGVSVPAFAMAQVPAAASWIAPQFENHRSSATGTHSLPFTPSNPSEVQPAPLITPSGVQWDRWQNGNFDHIYSHAEVAAMDPSGRDETFPVHWATRNTGGIRHQGHELAETVDHGKISLRSCLGVIQCSNSECHIITRPKTRQAAIVNQVNTPCRCGHNTEHTPCSVKTRITTFRRGVRYQNFGSHTHPKPHPIHLTAIEEDQLRDVLNANPKAGPLNLVVGATGPTGQRESVGVISPALLNKDRVNYERRKAGFQGFTGGDKFIQDFAEFERGHPDFIVDKEFGELTAVVMQTSFMASQAVKDLQSVAVKSLNGFCSDASM